MFMQSPIPAGGKPDLTDADVLHGSNGIHSVDAEASSEYDWLGWDAWVCTDNPQ